MCCFVLLLNDSGTLMSCFCFSMSCFGSRMSCFFHRTCVYRFFNSLSSPKRRFLKNNSRYSVVSRIPLVYHPFDLSPFNSTILPYSVRLFHCLTQVFNSIIILCVDFNLDKIFCFGKFVVQKAYAFHMPCLREHVYWRNFANYVFLLT